MVARTLSRQSARNSPPHTVLNYGGMDPMENLVLTALASGVTAADIRALVSEARDHGITTVVVPPHLLHVVGDQAIGQASVRIISTSGWPTGNHHVLVKAAEARLAVQSGAEGVIFVPDLGQLDNENALITEIVAVRESVPHPAALIVVLRAPNTSMIRTARMAGADQILIIDATPSDIAGIEGAVWAMSTDEAALLDAGASKVLMERG